MIKYIRIRASGEILGEPLDVSGLLVRVESGCSSPVGIPV